jgi:hypothetical protein
VHVFSKLRKCKCGSQSFRHCKYSQIVVQRNNVEGPRNRGMLLVKHMLIICHDFIIYFTLFLLEKTIKQCKENDVTKVKSSRFS